MDSEMSGSDVNTESGSVTDGGRWRRNVTRLYVLIALTGLIALGAYLARDVVDLIQLDESETVADEPIGPPTVEPTPAPRNWGTQLTWDFGIQTWRHWYVGGSDEHLQAIRGQGFNWIKQRFAWADLERRSGVISYIQSDWFMNGAESTGPDTKILIQLDVPPDWARTDGGDAPFDQDAWSNFVGDFAGHYNGRVHAYEILNEPNLAGAWGAEPDPVAYARVLGAARAAIAERDPNALVISAGMSPTATDLPNAIGDIEYLEALYAVMEANGGSDAYFDALGAHAPGFKAGPYVSPEEAAMNPEFGGQRFFTFRRVEDIRALMVARGDADKRIVVTEFGWTIDPRVDSPYHWSAVSREARVRFTRAAYQYAADNWAAWIGPLILFAAPDPAWGPNHEAYWRSITDGAGRLVDGLTLANIRAPSAAALAGGEIAEPSQEGIDDPGDPLVDSITSDSRGIRTAVLQLRNLPVSMDANAPVQTARRVGGAIVDSSQTGDRLVIGTGTEVELYDLSQSPPVRIGAVSTAQDGVPAELVEAVAVGEGLVAASTKSSVVLYDASEGLAELGRFFMPPESSGPVIHREHDLRIENGRVHAVRKVCVAALGTPAQGEGAVTSPSDSISEDSVVQSALTGIDCDLEAYATSRQLEPLWQWLDVGGSETEVQKAVVDVDGDLGYLGVGTTLRVHPLDPNDGLEAHRLDLGHEIDWLDVVDGVALSLSPYPAALHVLDISSGAGGPVVIDEMELTDMVYALIDQIQVWTSSAANVQTVAVPGMVCGQPCGWDALVFDIELRGGIEPSRTVRLADRDPSASEDAWSLGDAQLVGMNDAAVVVADASGMRAVPVEGSPGGEPSEAGYRLRDHMSAVGALASDGSLVVAATRGYLKVIDTASSAGMALLSGDVGALGAPDVGDRTIPLAGCGDWAQPAVADIAMLGSKIAIATTDGLIALDLSAPDPSATVECTYLGFGVRALFTVNDRILAAGESLMTGERQLAVIDPRPDTPVVEATVSFGPALDAEETGLPAIIRGIAVSPTSTAAGADGSEGGGEVWTIHVIDDAEWSIFRMGTAEGAVPEHIGSYGVQPRDVTALGDTVYVAVAPCGRDCPGGVRAFALGPEGYPEEIGALGLPEEVTRLAVSADSGTLWVTGPTATYAIEVSDPAAMRLLRTVAAGGDTIATLPGRVLLGAGRFGLTVIDE